MDKHYMSIDRMENETKSRRLYPEGEVDDDRTLAYDRCAICRNSLRGRCMECEIFLPSTAVDNQTLPPCHIYSDACTIKCNGVCSGHYFHTACIERWRKTRDSCPLCYRFHYK